MANEFPTLRLLAAIVDNGCDDTTPGELANKLTELGCRLDDSVDRYSCAKLMSGGQRDDAYSDPAWVWAVTVSRALHSHHGYVLLEAEEVSYLFKCHGKDKPKLVLKYGTPRGMLWMEDPGEEQEWEWDDTDIPSPWALVVHDEYALYKNDLNWW